VEASTSDLVLHHIRSVYLLFLRSSLVYLCSPLCICFVGVCAFCLFISLYALSMWFATFRFVPFFWTWETTWCGSHCISQILYLVSGIWLQEVLHRIYMCAALSRAHQHICIFTYGTAPTRPLSLRHRFRPLGINTFSQQKKIYNLWWSICFYISIWDRQQNLGALRIFYNILNRNIFKFVFII